MVTLCDGDDFGMQQFATLAALLCRQSSGWTIPTGAECGSRRLLVRNSFEFCRTTLRVMAGEPAVVIYGAFIPAFRGDFVAESLTSSPASLVRAWYRGRAGLRGILLAPATVAKLCQALGLDPCSRIRGALSGNNLLLLFGRRGGQAAVVHVARAPLARADIERHASGLQLAAAMLGNKAGFRVPAALARGSVADCPFLVQERIPGTVPTTEAAHAPEAALEALFELQGATAVPDATAEQEFLHREGEIICRSVPASCRPAVFRLLDHSRRLFATERLPGALVHGDYWLRNILFGAAGNVVGVVDWEWARAAGAPLLDVLHLLAGTLQQPGGPGAAAALGALARAEAPAATTRALGQALTRHGLHRRHVQPLAGLLLLRWIWQGFCLTWSGGEPWLAALLRDAGAVT